MAMKPIKTCIILFHLYFMFRGSYRKLGQILPKEQLLKIYYILRNLPKNKEFLVPVFGLLLYGWHLLLYVFWIRTMLIGYLQDNGQMPMVNQLLQDQHVLIMMMARQML